MLNYFAAASSSSGGSSPPVQTFDSILVFIGGQSNAQGVGVGPPASPYNSPITNADIWTGAQFDTLEYNVNNEGAGGSGTFGCELSLGYRLVELFGHKIYIDKFAVSNRGLSQNPELEDFHPYSYELFVPLKQELKAAYDYLVNTLGKNPLVIGLWNGNESDVALQILANKWYSSFLVFRKDLNEYTGANIIWYVSRLGLPQRNAYAHIEGGVPWDTVRQAQIDLIANFDDIHLINYDDKTLNGDGVHWDGDSNIAIGNEVAQDIYDKYTDRIIT